MNYVKHNVLDLKQPTLRGLLNELYQDTVTGSVNRFTPSVDVYESEGHYGIILAVPGMDKENIKIDIQDDKLYVSGERKLYMNDGIKYHIQET